MNSFNVFCGSASNALATDICSNLDHPMGNVITQKFSDGEIGVQIFESVRGQDIFIVQSTCAPANDNLIELLLMIDALKRSSAKTIIAIIPYFGYARQDRKVAPRVPISAKMVSNLIEKAGADRVVTMDLHAGQIQGFFDIPVDNLYGSVLFSEFLRKQNLPNPIMASPDIGGVARARSLAKRLDLDLVIVDKRREKANHSEVMNIIGDPCDKDVILIDDIIDTAGTVANAARAFKQKGARSVIVCATHAVLSGKAYENLSDDAIDKVVVTDTIAIQKEKLLPKFEILSTAPLFAEVIRRINNNESVNCLFDTQ